MRERIKDWGAGLCRSLGKKLVELTGASRSHLVLAQPTALISHPESTSCAQMSFLQIFAFLSVLPNLT